MKSFFLVLLATQLLSVSHTAHGQSPQMYCRLSGGLHQFCHNQPNPRLLDETFRGAYFEVSAFSSIEKRMSAGVLLEYAFSFKGSRRASSSGQSAFPAFGLLLNMARERKNPISFLLATGYVWNKTESYKTHEDWGLMIQSGIEMQLRDKHRVNLRHKWLGNLSLHKYLSIGYTWLIF